jgi:subtilase family serine protease
MQRKNSHTKARLFSRLLVLQAVTLLLALSAGAQAQRPLVPGPPLTWEARPPIHVRPFATTSPIGYRPDQIRKAYGFDQLPATGAGQTIAIVDAYGSPTIKNDISVFNNTFGLAQFNVGGPTFQIVGSAPQTNSGWALETALDVEWAHAIAPGANILLVVARSSRFNDLLNAVDYAASHAQVVSMSWGGSEFSSEASYDSHFNKIGVTFTASSGDSGAGVEWPAVSPYVTAVGGTTLYLDSANNWASELAWSGSGGGISSYESEPNFQAPWQSTNRRTVPDVSYNADPSTGVPVYDTTPNQGQSGWFQVGGTSAGAPQWAALVALANASSSPVYPCNSKLYSLGSPSTFTSYFHDVTSGSNGAYSTGPGYDLVTGIGSPQANMLIPAM